MILKRHLFLTGLCALLSVGVASAQTIGTVENTIVSNTDSPNTILIDLTTGSANFDGAAGSLPDPGSPELMLGDGTVEAYLFVDGDNTTGVSNVIATDGGIFSDVTIVGLPDDPSNGNPTTSGVQTDNLTLTLPDGVTVIMGMSPGTDTGHRASNLTGTIDISGFTSGTVYAIFGHLNADQSQITFSTSTQIVASDPIGGSLSTDGSLISAFPFDNSAGGSTLSYSFQSTDIDGSNARFYGFVVDGVIDDIGVVKGDVNTDGEVNFSDIPPFIAVLQSSGNQPEADVNCDGVVNFSDIPPFIAVLQGQ